MYSSALLLLFKYDQGALDMLLAWMVVLPLPRSFCSKVSQLVPGHPLFWYTAAAWGLPVTYIVTAVDVISCGRCLT